MANAKFRHRGEILPSRYRYGVPGHAPRLSGADRHVAATPWQEQRHRGLGKSFRKRRLQAGFGRSVRLGNGKDRLG
jgi:hypothetical protein